MSMYHIVGNIASIESIHPTFGDLDQDLDQDLIIGTSNGKIYFIENIGNNNDWPIFNNEITDLNIDVGSHASPQLIDLNRDGLLDLVIGERSGKDLSDDPPILEGLNYFQNIGSETSFQFDDQTPIFYNLDENKIFSLKNIKIISSAIIVLLLAIFLLPKVAFVLDDDDETFFLGYLDVAFFFVHCLPQTMV